MKNSKLWLVGLTALIVGGLSTNINAQQPQEQAAPIITSPNQALKVGIVNTKKCLEESKLGKSEQANLEKLKTQMASVLQEKDKELMEIESKLMDENDNDNLSDDTILELNAKKRKLYNEGSQLKELYTQNWQQANMKFLQKITDAISKASAQVAKNETGDTIFDAIFTDEACTFFSPKLDITQKVIDQMNSAFEAEQKK